MAQTSEKYAFLHVDCNKMFVPMNKEVISDYVLDFGFNSCQVNERLSSFEWPELLEKHEPTVYAQDALVEYNIGTDSTYRPIMVSGLLTKDQQIELSQFVAKHQDCLAWDYTEMPGLDKQLIEHRLPIKPNFRPV